MEDGRGTSGRELPPRAYLAIAECVLGLAHAQNNTRDGDRYDVCGKPNSQPSGFEWGGRLGKKGGPHFRVGS